MNDYDQLLKYEKDTNLLKTIKTHLGWDSVTYLPPNGNSLRFTQQTQLSGLIFDRSTDKKFVKLMKNVQSIGSSLTIVQQRNFFLIQNDYNNLIKVPKDLSLKVENQQNKSRISWLNAKAHKDFNLFQPDLEKLVELKIKVANNIDSDKDPFDVYLHQFERGMTSKRLTRIFNELKPALMKLVNKCQESDMKPDPGIRNLHVSFEKQKLLANDLAKTVGYDLESGRIDHTEHPLTIGASPKDVRITVHFGKDLFRMIYGTLHEAGHGIHGQNISSDYYLEPIGKGASAGINESQSRFVENIIGRSEAFWKFYIKRFKQIIGQNTLELNELLLAMNAVQKSKIRTLSDEVTYCLHIIVRFEIEHDLLGDKIDIKDLSSIWNQKMHDYLDVDIVNDREGVLQDIHWSSRWYGYFPTYALGNIYGAQFLKKMQKDLPVFDLIEKGEIQTIIAWLNKNIHNPGSLYDPEDLVERVTGESINIAPYIDYLNKKYSKLYNF